MILRKNNKYSRVEALKNRNKLNSICIKNKYKKRIYFNARKYNKKNKERSLNNH